MLCGLFMNPDVSGYLNKGNYIPGSDGLNSALGTFSCWLTDIHSQWHYTKLIVYSVTLYAYCSIWMSTMLHMRVCFMCLIPGCIHCSAENANGVITCSLTETMFQGWWIKSCSGTSMTSAALESQSCVKCSSKFKFTVSFNREGWENSLKSQSNGTVSVEL